MPVIELWPCMICRCEQMGPEIVYVSGRRRAMGEMNGKSANLNNCLSYLYPAGTTIPANELVCIFDADQVCYNSSSWPHLGSPTHVPTAAISLLHGSSVPSFAPKTELCSPRGITTENH